jgi:hypothetical protein
MAASDAGAIVLGAAIGAGSAIVTQVIALIAESKRERKRVQREQERFDRELELRMDERFLISSRICTADWVFSPAS